MSGDLVVVEPDDRQVPGIRSPRCCATARPAMAIRSLAYRIAVGRSAASSIIRVASAPPAALKSVSS